MKNTNSVNMKSGNRDEIEGAAKNLSGGVKKGAGRMLGNPDLERRGNREQAEGTVQKKIGQIKKVFGK